MELHSVAERLGLEVEIQGWPTALPSRAQASILVCTVPAEGAGGLAEHVPEAPGWLLDVSYSPWPPPLVAAWQRAGGRAVAGDEMLLHQAVEQVRLMTGSVPDAAAMRSALQGELDRRRGAQGTQVR